MKNQSKMPKNKSKIFQISVIKHNILRIFIIFLFISISLILLKKFNQYFNQKDFAKLGIIIIIFINFLVASCIKSFEKKKFNFFYLFRINFVFSE